MKSHTCFVSGPDLLIIFRTLVILSQTHVEHQMSCFVHMQCVVDRSSQHLCSCVPRMLFNLEFVCAWRQPNTSTLIRLKSWPRVQKRTVPAQQRKKSFNKQPAAKSMNCLIFRVDVFASVLKILWKGNYKFTACSSFDRNESVLNRGQLSHLLCAAAGFLLKWKMEWL